MNTEPLRSLLKPSTRSSGIKEPANERPHQPSETLHGFGGSPGRVGGGLAVVGAGDGCWGYGRGFGEGLASGVGWRARLELWLRGILEPGVGFRR